MWHFPYLCIFSKGRPWLTYVTMLLRAAGHVNLLTPHAGLVALFLDPGELLFSPVLKPPYIYGIYGGGQLLRIYDSRTTRPFPKDPFLFRSQHPSLKVKERYSII